MKISSRTIFPLKERTIVTNWLKFGQKALDKAEVDLESLQEKYKKLKLNLANMDSNYAELNSKHEKLFNDYSCLLEEYSNLKDIQDGINTSKGK